jgi:polysaccharide biosynthesis transport protein
MKDKPFDSSVNTLSQFQGVGPSGLADPLQGAGLNPGAIFASVRKYWYVSLLLSSLIMAGTVYRTAKQPRIYKSEIQIALEQKSAGSFTEKLTGGSTSSSEDKSTNVDTIAQILKSKSIVQKALDTIPESALKPDIDDVLDGLKVQSEKNSDFLSVSYSSTNPERIVAVLNALSKVYIDYSVKIKKARTDKSIAFIESQLPESRKRLSGSAQDVEQFRQKYRFFDPETSSKVLSDYRQSVIAKLDESRVQQSQTQQQYAELKKQLNKVGLNSNSNLSTTMLTQDSSYQELSKKLNDLELIYNQEKVRFSDNNLIVVTAKEKRDQVLLLLKKRAQQVLNRNVSDTELTNGSISNFSNGLAQNFSSKQADIETNLAAQSAQYQSLYNVYQQIELQLAQLPTLQKQYTELQRQYTIYSQELTSFLQKLQELKIADAEQVVPWSLVDPPELPEEPVSPDVKRQLGLGALISLLAGVLAAVGLNKLSNKIDDPDVIKSITGMSVLTMIPKVKSFDQRAVQKTSLQVDKGQTLSHWGFVDAIRNLSLGIGLTSGRRGDHIGKLIAITSSVPKEGKSTIAFHASIALADLGYNVLLVDADLSTPNIDKLCRSSPLFESVDLDGQYGLSDVLLRDDDWRNFVKKSLEIRLDVLFSGSQSMNSILLLNSPNFSRLIEQWRNEYDYVIFDTPCVVGVSDTRLIGSLVDALVFVVSMSTAKHQTIDRALDIVTSINTPVLGLVINQIADRYSDYSKYYQKETTLLKIK